MRKYEVKIEELYEAYYDCRRRKRNKPSALAFEMHYESELHRLHEELETGRYEIGRSVCFCVTRPKLREVFAASFRDRVVHHLLMRKISKLVESQMIDDSYSCRVRKGTDYGVMRIAEKMRRASENYTREAWVMKCDLSGFFMSIDKERLWQMLRTLIERGYTDEDKDFVLWLTHMIVMHRPEQRCEIHGDTGLFAMLPDNKTLFRSNGKGMPIGNLTSQIFGNYYLSGFDKWMMHRLGDGYGRYVDDFVCIHRDKKYLLSLLGDVRRYLREELGLTLHPSKVYLQDVRKGVKFTGQMIKPNRIYVGNRTVNNAFNAISRYEGGDIDRLLTLTNCYAGFMRGKKAAYDIRHKLLTIAWRKSEGMAYADMHWRKLVIKKRYNERILRRRAIRNERRNKKIWAETVRT